LISRFIANANKTEVCFDLLEQLRKVAMLIKIEISKWMLNIITW